MKSNKPIVQSHKFLDEERQFSKQLVVNIHINSTQTKELRLFDTEDINHIDNEIREFVNSHRMKTKAFSYIKDAIMKEINKNNESSNYSTSKKSKPANHQKKEQRLSINKSKSKSKTCKHCQCKCESKQKKFKQKQKIYSCISSKENFHSSHKKPISPSKMSLGFSGKSGIFKSNTHKKKTEPISNIDPNAIFNSSFNLQSSLDPIQPTVDDLINGLSSISFEGNNSKLFSEPKDFNNSKQIAPKILQLEDILTTPFQNNTFELFNSIQLDKPPSSQNIAPQKEIKSKSPRSKHIKLVFNLKSQNVVSPSEKQTKPEPKSYRINRNRSKSKKKETSHQMTASKIQEEVKKQFKLIKEQNQANAASAPSSLCSSTKKLEDVFIQLFQKLIRNNPNSLKCMNPTYIDYQLLTENQLWFMNVFLQRIDYRDLQNLDFDRFRINIIKYCWKEAQKLTEEWPHSMSKQNSLFL